MQSKKHDERTESYICSLLAINYIQLSDIIFALIFLARVHLCALLDTKTQDDNQDNAFNTTAEERRSHFQPKKILLNDQECAFSIPYKNVADNFQWNF